MERIQKIQKHPLFQDLFEKLQQLEKDRPFCRHTMEHFLDVARLMYIYDLEDGASIPKEVIYAAALLHDLGRYEQLTRGIPHDIAGSEAAELIMKDCEFQTEEIEAVKKAILGHRDAASLSSDLLLTAYLYRADKKSRNCFACPSEPECNWPEEKKNLWIEY